MQPKDLKQTFSLKALSPQIIKCPHCGSQDYQKTGTSGTVNKKQCYRCKSCKHCYVLDPKNKLEVTDGFDFYHDVWTAETLFVKYG